MTNNHTERNTERNTPAQHPPQCCGQKPNATLSATLLRNTCNKRTQHRVFYKHGCCAVSQTVSNPKKTTPHPQPPPPPHHLITFNKSKATEDKQRMTPPTPDNPTISTLGGTPLPGDRYKAGGSTFSLSGWFSRG